VVEWPADNLCDAFGGGSPGKAAVLLFPLGGLLDDRTNGKRRPDLSREAAFKQPQFASRLQFPTPAPGPISPNPWLYEVRISGLSHLLPAPRTIRIGVHFPNIRQASVT